MDHSTAKMSCFIRGYHTEHASVPVFRDTFAASLLGDEYTAIGQNLIWGRGNCLPGFTGGEDEALDRIVNQKIGPNVLGRSAFCERAFETGYRPDMRQVLLLAAGLDTFALRHANRGIHFFEMDLPDMIAYKQKRVRQIVPDSDCRFIPCDLSREFPADKLLEAGSDFKQRTFVALTGFVYYIDKKAFMVFVDRLAMVLQQDSVICFDYPARGESEAVRQNSDLAAAAGEEMKSRYSATEMEKTLADAGFRVCEDIGGREVEEAFFAAYNTAEPNCVMRMPAGFRFCTAVKKHTKCANLNGMIENIGK